MKYRWSAVVLVCASAWVGSLAHAVEYRPQALADILDQAEWVKQQGESPVVVFDVDDTLLDSRTRSSEIFREFARLPTNRESFPAEMRALESVQPSQIRYQLEDTARDLGIENKELIQKLNSFWREKFFSSEYCALDAETPGAGRYLRALDRADVRIVYLTGRDEPHMREGTELSFIRRGFPLGARTILMMKPDAKMDDLEFKRQAFAQIHPLGRVIGVFENEPRNLNALATEFSGSIAVFVDSIHSSRPDLPVEDAAWIKDFQGFFFSNKNLPPM
jgi:hypothetical protein